MKRPRKRPATVAEKPRREANPLRPAVLRKVQAALVELVPSDVLARARAWYQPTVVGEGTHVACGLAEVPVRRPSVLVFLDEAPGYNWAHPARLMLFDADQGELEAQYPVHAWPTLLADSLRRLEVPAVKANAGPVEGRAGERRAATPPRRPVGRRSSR